MKVLRCLPIAFLTLAFTACTTLINRVPVNTAAITPSITPTELVPTKTRLPAPPLTATSPAATSTVTPRTGPPPLEVQHLQVKAELPSEENIQGVLVLASSFHEELLDGYLFERLHLWNLETNQEQERVLDGFPIFDAMISPDHRWLAYRPPWSDDEQIEKQNAFLVVLDAAGQERYFAYWQGDKPRVTYWLNNEQIALRRKGEDIFSFLTLMGVINPFDGAYQELPPDPSDLYDLWPFPKWENGMVVYDPTRTYRAYLNGQEDLALENLETNEVIGTYDVAFDATPRWSPDGRQLLFSKITSRERINESFDLVILDLQGFETVLFSKPDSYVYDAFWSDDGKKVAFWISPDGLFRANLAIVDLETNQVTIYDFQVSYYPKPVLSWSPDSEFLLVGYFMKEEENHTLHGLLVKWQDAWAVKLPENKIPIGWMVMP